MKNKILLFILLILTISELSAGRSYPMSVMSEIMPTAIQGINTKVTGMFANYSSKVSQSVNTMKEINTLYEKRKEHLKTLSNTNKTTEVYLKSINHNIQAIKDIEANQGLR